MEIFVLHISEDFKFMLSVYIFCSDFSVDLFVLLVISLELDNLYGSEQLTYSCSTANIVEIRVPLTNQMMLGLNEIFTCFHKR